jgi:hypothetical protein
LNCNLSVWFEQLITGDKIKAITVIGSGGKTSLIWHLAKTLFLSSGQNRRILVAPTTKMYMPQNPVPGITLVGMYNKTSGKLEALPLCELEAMARDYDLVLMEGDGSKGLPLKAWTEDEPVVPSFTDLTIGMLPLWPLGKPVSEKLAFRLDLFLNLTGAAEGELLAPEHIVRIITGGKLPGLFAKARGKKYLFF